MNYAILLGRTILCGLLASLLISNAAFASPKEARNRYIEGKKAYDNGDYEEAGKKFDEAHQLLGKTKAKLMLMIARTQAKLRNFARAKEAAIKYLDSKPDETTLEFVQMSKLADRAKERAKIQGDLFSETTYNCSRARSEYDENYGGDPGGWLDMEPGKKALSRCLRLLDRSQQAGVPGLTFDTSKFRLMHKNFMAYDKEFRWLDEERESLSSILDARNKNEKNLDKYLEDFQYRESSIRRNHKPLYEWAKSPINHLRRQRMIRLNELVGNAKGEELDAKSKHSEAWWKYSGGYLMLLASIASAQLYLMDDIPGWFAPAVSVFGVSSSITLFVKGGIASGQSDRHEEYAEEVWAEAEKMERLIRPLIDEEPNLPNYKRQNWDESNFSWWSVLGILAGAGAASAGILQGTNALDDARRGVVNARDDATLADGLLIGGAATFAISSLWLLGTI